MKTNQPKWKLIANLGDASPLDYGGFFVYRDETGVYDPEAELLECPEEDVKGPAYTVRRFSLEQCTLLFPDAETESDFWQREIPCDRAILSNNPFHLYSHEWFAQPEADKAKRPQDNTYLSCLCETMDIDIVKLQKMFCSKDILERAQAYRMVGEYHGFDNLDHDPLQLTLAEVKKRYRKEMNQLKKERMAGV